MHRFANPAQFMRIAQRVQPWAALITGLLFVVGLYYALWASPADYQQSQTVRIMYVHVPAAWMALFVYSSMAVAAGSALVWKHPLADLWAKACAPIGAGFTALCLLTGMLWGEPMWGTWWVWDARLTSVLVLFFLYLGYSALVGAFDDPERGLKAGNVLLLVGVINVPIVKFSVDWWNTLHQPASVSRLDAPGVHPDMLLPLLIMWAAYMGFFIVVAILRMRAELLDRRLTALRLAQARTP